MADLDPTSETLQNLHRLSTKPGVQSTLILSRADGAIVRATGLLRGKSRVPGPAGGRDIGGGEGEAGIGAGPGAGAEAEANGTDGFGAANGDGANLGQRDAEHIASAVWRFFRAAGETAGEMGVGVGGRVTGKGGNGGGNEKNNVKGSDNRTARGTAQGEMKSKSSSGGGDDEVKLLRLRLRRCEVVVVPDPKFLLVVIHDTPPA